MNSTKGDNTPTNTLREFTQSQELFDAYKKYLSLDDMTMVEFANIMYPLVSEAVNKARIEELEATVINPIAGKSWLDVRPDVELQRVHQRLRVLKLNELETPNQVEEIE